MAEYSLPSNILSPTNSALSPFPAHILTLFLESPPSPQALHQWPPPNYAMKRLIRSLHNRAIQPIQLFSFFLIGILPVSSLAAQDIVISGELKLWHPITLTLDGPTAEEEGETNPFLDYRLEVTFTQGGTSIVVPGYFAADGNAAETGATNGSKWRVHFVPRSTGEWTYTVSMRSGTDIAISDLAGQPTPQDGLTGSFTIGESDKQGRDFRGKGVLSYVNGPYLQFDNGDYFIKGGADSPENFLGYFEFDNTKDHGCQNNVLQDGLHRYEAHVSDWNQGDPVWHNDKGKGIIGALNYLSSKGINSVYFLPMNTEGDGCEVYPWTEYGDDASERLRYDVSKLDQWDIVFNHMDELGLMLHIVTQEQENDQLLDGGSLGTQRKLYYRELMARFGYHHGHHLESGRRKHEHAQPTHRVCQLPIFVRPLRSPRRCPYIPQSNWEYLRRLAGIS